MRRFVSLFVLLWALVCVHPAYRSYMERCSASSRDCFLVFRVRSR